MSVMLLLVAGAARAQADRPAAADSQAKPGSRDAVDNQSARPDEGKSWGLTFKQKAMTGSEGYRYSDSYLDVELPQGLDFNLDLSAYKTDTSSMSPTLTAGAGWVNGNVTFTGFYAYTMLANDYEARAVDLGVSVRNESKDFRTTLAVDVNVTHHYNYLRFPRFTNTQETTQRTPTASLTQRFFWNWSASVALSESAYNKDILAYTRSLNARRFRAIGKYDSNLTGLISGFPDWTVKAGLGYDFDDLPLTLRGTYESVKLEDTAQGTNSTADAQTYAVDYDFAQWLTVTAEYDHYRQTSQASTDQFGGRVALRY